MNQTFDILFVTTFIRPDTVDILLDSILAHNQSVRIGMVLVAQNNLPFDASRYESDYLTLFPITIPNQVNSSRGRNIGIEYIHRHDLQSTFVMFPDDDTSFDAVFFQTVPTLNPKLCYALDVRNSDTDGFRLKIPSTHVGQEGWKVIGATNMLLSYEVFRHTGVFDEAMGVGAEYGAGEDGDYYLRSLAYAREYHYIETLYNYHPSGGKRYQELSLSALISRFHHYGRGVIYMLCKHKLYGQALGLTFKALAGSVLRLCQLNFKMSLVYQIAFYSRFLLFCRILFQRKSFYDHRQHRHV